LSHDRYKRYGNDDSCNPDDVRQSDNGHAHLLVPVAPASQHAVAMFGSALSVHTRSEYCIAAHTVHARSTLIQ
jgi:hypothetical protein